jgi:hypothetical protein
LELEVVNLKNKNEKTNVTIKFHNSSVILDRIVKYYPMTKLVLGTIRKKKVVSGTPFPIIIKAHPPEREKVQSQTKYKLKILLKKEAIKVKTKKHIKRKTSHVKTNSSMETTSMFIVFLVITLVINQLNGKFEMKNKKYNENIAPEIDKKMMGEMPNKEYEHQSCAYKVDQAQERRIPKEEHDKSADLDNILQINCPLANKWKIQKENYKE